jgi:hypothetical protein
MEVWKGINKQRSLSRAPLHTLRSNNETESHSDEYSTKYLSFVYEKAKESCWKVDSDDSEMFSATATCASADAHQ